MQLGDSTRGLIVRLGAAVCFLPLADVIEIMRPRPVETLVGLPPYIRGVAIIRGAPVPVVDLGPVIGVSSPEARTRFVTLRLGPRSAALAVGGVVGVRDLDEEAVGEMPPLLRETSDDLIRTIGTLDAQLLVVLRAGRVVVGQGVWDTLDAREASP
jgi:purine-binding chemotaxis protein CheW